MGQLLTECDGRTYMGYHPLNSQAMQNHVSENRIIRTINHSTPTCEADKAVSRKAPLLQPDYHTIAGIDCYNLYKSTNVDISLLIW
jgi:hypothetical protein